MSSIYVSMVLLSLQLSAQNVQLVQQVLAKAESLYVSNGSLPGIKRDSVNPEHPGVLTWEMIRGKRMDDAVLEFVRESILSYGEPVSISKEVIRKLQWDGLALRLCDANGKRGFAGIKFFRGFVELMVPFPMRIGSFRNLGEKSIYFLDEYGIQYRILLDCFRSAFPNAAPSLIFTEKELIEYHAWTAFGHYWELPKSDVEKIKAHVKAKIAAFEKHLVATADDPAYAWLYEVRKPDPKHPGKTLYKRKPEALEKEWKRWGKDWDAKHPLKLSRPVPVGVKKKSSGK